MVFALPAWFSWVKWEDGMGDQAGAPAPAGLETWHVGEPASLYRSAAASGIWAAGRCLNRSTPFPGLHLAHQAANS